MPSTVLKMLKNPARSLLIMAGIVSGFFSFIPTCAAESKVSADAPCLARGGDAIPRDAYLLPVAQASEIQRALDQHLIVKLEPGADYSKGGGLIRMSSGQKLYGLAGTKIGQVVIEGGATGAVLSGIATGGVEFFASEEETRGNCFYRLTGPITIKGAKLVDNTFIDITNTKIDIDTRHSGYLRNNRFIRIMMHGSYPALRMLGDSKRLSGGNVFLWLNILTPSGDGIIIDGQDDVTFVGLDVESWNWHRLATNPAMMTVTNTGTLRLMAISGGDQKNRDGTYLDAGADEAQIFGMRIGQVGDPAVILRPQVKRFYSSNMKNLSISDLTSDSFLMKAFTSDEPEVIINGTYTRDKKLSADDLQILRSMLVDSRTPGDSWKRPVLAPIPDPAGPDWRNALSQNSDSSAYLQGLVDTQQIARVPAGIYYISQPIKLRSGQGIIGEGAERTVIIAQRPDIDMIIADEIAPQESKSVSFTLADITLQGGRNGIHHDIKNLQFNRVTMSHVTFRDMSESCIFIDGIYGWDNNFIDNVNFYRCGQAGIKQRDNRLSISGDDPGMAYMDKNVCYRCQFVESGRGLDLKAGRANNLNMFIDSVFRANTEFAATMTNNSSTVFANSDFINNGGDPVISSNKPVYFVNGYFRAVQDNVSMLPDNTTCEGCLFENGGAIGASIVTERTIAYHPTLIGYPRVFLYNSKSIDMPLGTRNSGILVNSHLSRNKQLSHQALFMYNSNVNVLAEGMLNPLSRFLIRRNFGSSQLSPPRPPTLESNL